MWGKVVDSVQTIRSKSKEGFWRGWTSLTCWFWGTTEKQKNYHFYLIYFWWWGVCIWNGPDLKQRVSRLQLFLLLQVSISHFLLNPVALGPRIRDQGLLRHEARVMLRPGTWVREMKTPDGSALVSHGFILSPQPPGLVDYKLFFTKGTFEELIGGVRRAQFWFLKPVSPRSGFIFHPQTPPWALRYLWNGLFALIFCHHRCWTEPTTDFKKWKLMTQRRSKCFQMKRTIPQKSKALKVTRQEIANDPFLLLGWVILPGYKGLHPVLL